MPGKNKTRGGRKPARRQPPAKRAKTKGKPRSKSLKNKKLAGAARVKSPPSPAKPAAAKPAKGQGAGAARKPASRAKAPAAKRIAPVKPPAPARAALRRPVPRKAPPRSIAARRAAPPPSPRKPAVARPRLPAATTPAGAPTTVARPPAPTTPSAQAARPSAARPASPAVPPAAPAVARPPQPRPPAPKPSPAAAPKTGVRIAGRMGPGYESILSTQAVDFVVALERRFRADYKRLLAQREERQRRLDAGERPDFLPETVNIRNGDWTVAPLPRDLHDRRVEITGPPERKMVINALNSGASCFMADFEDATSPTWANVIEGQINLRDAVAGTIAYKDPAGGREYRLNPRVAVLIARPRGLHMPEKHLIVDGEPVSAALFDFGLYFFHNARPLIRNGTGPYFYLPKLESHHEARLWNDVFLHAQRAFGLPRGTIKVTVLIETLPAAFEMDEILYELRDHAAGLNAGRWDYIFSFIKKFRNDRSKMLPDRSRVTMTTHFLRSYSQLLIKTCHRREVHAMGGMAAQIPIKDDAHANQEALDKVRQDKEREVAEGHDGTWVAHPALVPVAKAVFDRAMPHPNQIARRRPDVQVSAADLLQVPPGPKTEAGLRQNVAVGVAYIESWLRGVGCVPLFNLMEDAATAEISRAQVWQWIRHGARLEDGRPVSAALCRQIVAEEVAKARAGMKPGRPDRFDDAAALFQRLVEAPECAEFLTLAAYEMLGD
jgi:malate synthase